MKHLVFYITLSVMIGMMLVIILNNQEKPVGKVISVAQYYSYLNDKEETIDVLLFVNDMTHPLVTIESHDTLFLQNEDGSKKIEVILEAIVLGHEESYLNERYQQLIYQMKMPYLHGDFLIEDAYLQMDLINEDTYRFYIGSFSLIAAQTDHQYLDWTALEGMKKEHTYISRVHQIEITFDTLAEPIESVMIGVDCLVDFMIINQQLILTIPHQNLLLNDVPIVITFQNQGIQTISNFKYVVDYQILKESGMLTYTYALN